MRHTDTSPANPLSSNHFLETPSDHSSPAQVDRPDGDCSASVASTPHTSQAIASASTDSTSTPLAGPAVAQAWQRPPILDQVPIPDHNHRESRQSEIHSAGSDAPSSDAPSSDALSPRYIWVAGAQETAGEAAIGPGHQRPAGNGSARPQGSQRYHVISASVWQDTQPHRPCTAANVVLSPEALMYLRFYPYALHLPTLYGVVPSTDAPWDVAPWDVAPWADAPSSQNQAPLILLDNVPIDAAGQLLPSIQDCWAIASPLRQVNWLWQLAELWQVLGCWNQTATLLEPKNIRVDGWRIRLVEVWSNHLWDQGTWLHEASSPLRTEGLGQSLRSRDEQNGPRPINWYLAQLWQSWAERGAAELVEPLGQICNTLRKPHVIWSHVKRDLNLLLLQQAAQRPLKLAIAGGSRVGSARSHNEDTCYPDHGSGPDDDVADSASVGMSKGMSKVAAVFNPAVNQPSVNTSHATSPNSSHNTYDVSSIFRAPKPWEELDPYVGIVCDGLAGHVQGELASQLVTRSLKLQLGAFLTEVESQKTTADLIEPDVVVDQLAAIVRIVNNVLMAQRSLPTRPSPTAALTPTGSERQEPTGRDRMATTAVFAVQLPQAITTNQKLRNSHELYVVSVGDSRAYWLTPTACHPLTQDDTVVSRRMMGQMMGQMAGQIKGQMAGQIKGQMAGQIKSPLTEPTSGQKVGEPAAASGQSYHDAQLQPDASQLAQALGTKDGDALTIQVRRLVVDEDGILLLCSDGLSHGHHIERHGQAITTAILRGELSLDAAVQEWLNLGQDDYGDDISVVMMQCGVPPKAPKMISKASNVGPRTLDANNRAVSDSDLIFDAAMLMPQGPDSGDDAGPLTEDVNTSEEGNGGRLCEAGADSVGLAFDADVAPDAEMSTELNRQTALSQPWRQLVVGGVVAMGTAIALLLAAWRYLDPVLFDRVVVQSAEQLVEQVQQRLGGASKEETGSP